MRAAARLTFAMLLLTTPATATDMKLEYQDWTKQTPRERELVLSGLLDGLFGYTHHDTLGDWMTHFDRCIKEKELSNTDIVEGTDKYVAEVDPSQSHKKLMGVVLLYLEKECGKPMRDML